MTSGTESVFLQYGAVGAFLVICLLTIGFLYNEIRKRDKIIYDLQDKLLEMAVNHATTDTELANKVIETVGTLNELFSTKQGRGK